MANERKTETIVRELLRQNGYASNDDIVVEEQSSENPVIDNLLKKASKSGTGPGRPEFIVQFKKHPQLVLVVECKADAARHASLNMDDPEKYAVDGVLHYARFLLPKYDVISIGISGESRSKCEIDYYIAFKGKSQTHIADWSGEFVSVDDILSYYENRKHVLDIDLKSILPFADSLNQRLRNNGIKEQYRSLFVSAVLLALEQDSFRKTYQTDSENNILENVISRMFNDMQEVRNQDAVKQVLGSLRFHLKQQLMTKTGELKNLVNEIEYNLFTNRHSGSIDILSKMYIEFLRYSNNDKGLGIVLTPSHITDLAANMMEVNHEDVIYDNCAGTGSFLVSSLRKMIDSCQGMETLQNKVYRQGLCGVERNEEIYALCCSNLWLHRDGKSNVYLGDSSEPALKEEIKQRFKPNKGFINPPYNASRTELELVLDNLDVLSRDGLCCALVPTACALTTKPRHQIFRKQLLRSHTLEAVLTMPDQLFINSKVGVSTCLLVIRAHRTHNPDKKTWVAYCKNDGFVSVRRKGRIDENDRWAGVRDEWVKAFLNKEEHPGFSVMASVKGPEQNWLAEEFLEPDYATIQESDFRSFRGYWRLFEELA